MNQAHYLQLKQFIKIAFHDVNSHRECLDHASQRVMMYSYGRVVGAYAMCGVGFLSSDDHKTIQELEEAYHDAMSMNIY
jgi:hypothetical protein